MEPAGAEIFVSASANPPFGKPDAFHKTHPPPSLAFPVSMESAEPVAVKLQKMDVTPEELEQLAAARERAESAARVQHVKVLGAASSEMLNNLSSMKRAGAATARVDKALRQLNLAASAIFKHEEDAPGIASRLERAEAALAEAERELHAMTARKHSAKKAAQLREDIERYRARVKYEGDALAPAKMKTLEDVMRDAHAELVEAAEAWALPSKGAVFAVKADYDAAEKAFQEARGKLSPQERYAL